MESNHLNFYGESSSQIFEQKYQKSEDKTAANLSGRWTSEEHKLFLIYLHRYGKNWKKIAKEITSRTPTQIRSHAQKYLSKLSKEDGRIVTSVASIDNITYENSLAKPTNISATALAIIEEIKNDPSSVEEEVKATLKSLHEMYNNLQLLILKSRLQETISSNASNSSNKIQLPSQKNEKKMENSKARKMNNAIDSTLFDKTEPSSIACTSVQRQEFGGQELIAIQVLGTFLNTAVVGTIEPTSNTLKRANVTEGKDIKSKRKRKFDELFDMS